MQSTLHLLPGALGKTKQGLGKLAVAARVIGPTLKELEPFAKLDALPRRMPRRALFDQDDAGLQEPDPPVRAPDPARGQPDRSPPPRN